MSESSTSRLARADYGLDAPGVITTMLVIGAACIVVGTIVLHLGPGARGGRSGIASALDSTGLGLLFGSVFMVLSSSWGKLRARDHLLDRMALTGSETVLDVGCGHGLMLVGAARRLTTGKAIGVDLWSQVDQKSNSSAATIANACAEGVADRVQVLDGDMRALPLENESVDVVLSSLAIHNVTGRNERRRAIQEIVRVLKPGGRVGIMDIGHVGAYASDFRDAGMTEVTSRGLARWIFPPTRVLTAVK